jgi:HK97 family phage major capsid protein
MALTIEQKEQRAGAWAQAQEFNERHKAEKAGNAGKPLTDADERAWQEALDTVERLGGLPTDWNVIERADHIMHETRDSSPRAEAFREYLRTGDEHELRAMGTTTGSSGGYTVPQGFWAKVTTSAKAFGGLRRLAESIPTDTGNDLPWPTNDDTGNVGHILGENTADDEGDVEFGEKTLGAYTYTSKIVRVSMQLAQDTGIDLESFVANRLGRRIGRAQAPHLISGTGASQPQGLLTGITVGKTTAANNAITYNELMDLVASVDPAYLAGDEVDGDPLGAPPEGVAWLMNFATYTYLGKIRDDSGGAGLGRPLLEPSVDGRRSRTLAGYPIVIDQGMPAIGSATKPIAFGNIRQAYVVRTVKGGEVLRLVERYADVLQVGFLAFERADGLVQDASAAKALQMLA